MTFTPKLYARPAISAVLAIAVIGLIGRVNYIAPAPAPIVANHDTLATQNSLEPTGAALSFAVMETTAPDFQAARSDYYQPVSSWYKNKGWWRRNAPIVGGVGGGALIGGLAGGGTGALIGGAVGGGGGYAYKRYRRHHRHY
jgi:hypothetical protein